MFFLDLYSKSKVTIDDCIIMDSNAHNLDWHVRDSIEMFNSKEIFDVHTAKCAPIHIGNHVLISIRCIILKGVTIGDDSVIATSSIVVKDIPANVIAGGNSWKIIELLD